MTEQKMHFKDLPKKDKRHLREMGVTTLRDMKRTAETQKQYREATGCEPCWSCRSIALKLGLSL